MSEPLTFWDHLDELRSSLLRMLGVTVLFGIIAFVLKDELFSIVLAPRSSDFLTYRLLGVEDFQPPPDEHRTDRTVHDSHADRHVCRTAGRLTLYII